MDQIVSIHLLHLILRLHLRHLGRLLYTCKAGISSCTAATNGSQLRHLVREVCDPFHLLNLPSSGTILVVVICHPAISTSTTWPADLGEDVGGNNLRTANQ